VDLSSKQKLAGFLKALEDKGVLSFNKNLFNNRLKVQKYVFIANEFGFGATYNYSLYIHGPYSSSLADDYYGIDNFQEKAALELDDRFVKLVKGKSEEWLELAATIIMIKKRYASITHDNLIGLVKTVKPYAERDCLKNIIDILEKNECLN
jgi:uncharacterized protein YwgA